MEDILGKHEIKKINKKILNMKNVNEPTYNCWYMVTKYSFSDLRIKTGGWVQNVL